MSETPETVRLDRWLWAARFFKTRSLATRAVSGGRVHLNGERTKPAHGVRAGDRLYISRGETVLELEVRAVSQRRGPATEAAKLYAETEASVAAREARRRRRRLEPAVGPLRRPDKRDRRVLGRLRRGEGGDS